MALLVQVETRITTETGLVINNHMQVLNIGALADSQLS